ncbi:fimbrial chaperone protein [Litorivivens lipolytica]|uniref:Fimbrial chaperone protein n=1 Tax=Litorivivens lipolytica TaxID=1524264 RepID=A0A7W4Z5T6_9GAMM|nr:molecular chaperone [Litorivivens lipolytica]MBB3047523.1 fimbrial chaperone protein [Litorivivens lipolytica]
MPCKTWIVTAFALLVSATTFSGSYSVRPVTIALSESTPATTLTVRNRESTPVTLQVATKKWVQNKGAEELRETRDIIAVPPTFTIAPGEEQTVRVGLRAYQSHPEEQAYRLLLQEIPGVSTPRGGLKFALHMSLPVFVRPEYPTAADLKWSVTRQRDGKVKLSVANTGNGHDKLTSWRLLKNSKEIGSESDLQYVLPGSQISWLIESNTAPSVGKEVEIIVANGPLERRTRALVQ